MWGLVETPASSAYRTACRSWCKTSAKISTICRSPPGLGQEPPQPSERLGQINGALLRKTPCLRSLLDSAASHRPCMLEEV